MADLQARLDDVFPTRVGVDRRPGPGTLTQQRFPHTRGGGPMVVVDGYKALVVFPTRVGVDRTRERRLVNWQSFPHTRGGGPVINEIDHEHFTFSPHAWGWTA